MRPAPVTAISTSDDELRRALKQALQSEVAAMNTANFIVRPEREHVERFRDLAAWTNLDDEAQGVLANHIAGLPSERPHEDISARLFDLTCLNLQVAQLDSDVKQAQRLIERIQALASGLESAQSIPAVKAQLALIHDVQTREFWEDITLAMIENLRRRLRGLIQFIEKKAFNPVYSALDDEIGEGVAVSLDDFQTGINLTQYRKKVAAFIRANEDHVAIAKLKHNRPLTPSDLGELERFVFDADEVESRERFTEAFGEDQPLTVFIRSLVGLDHAVPQKRHLPTSLTPKISSEKPDPFRRDDHRTINGKRYDRSGAIVRAAFHRLSLRRAGWRFCSGRRRPRDIDRARGEYQCASEAGCGLRS